MTLGGRAGTLNNPNQSLPNSYTCQNCISSVEKQWRGEIEASEVAARLMAPPPLPPQSYFFASWSGTRVMS